MNEEWCWWLDSEVDCEQWIGLFKSKEEAVDDAMKTKEAGDWVRVSKIRWLKPEFYAGQLADVTFFLEQMDEMVEDEVRPDDPVFCVLDVNEEKAQKELGEVLIAWATKWVVSEVWVPVDDGERICL